MSIMKLSAASIKNTQRIEFIEDQADVKEIIRHVVAFKNTNGGSIVLGIDLETKEPYDLSNLNILEYISDFQEILQKYSLPKIEINSINISSFQQNPILILNFSPGKGKPFRFINSLTKKKCILIRDNNHNKEISQKKFTKLSAKLKFNTASLNTWIPLSIIKNENLISLSDLGEEKYKSQRDIYLDLKLIQYLKNGSCELLLPLALYLDSNIMITKFPAAYIEYNDHTNSGETIKLQGCLYKQYYLIRKLFEKIVGRGCMIENKYHKNKFEYPADSLKALFLNAVVHRDYTIEKPIVVNKFDTYLEIINPGSLHPKDDLNSFNFSKNHRNPKLYELFTINFSEVNAFGIDDIVNEFEKYNYLNIEFIEGLDSFTVRIKKTVQHNLDIKKISARHSQIISFCSTAQKTQNIHKHLDRETIGRRTLSKYLKRLVDAELIRMTIPNKPKSKNQAYITTEKGKNFLKII